MLAALAAQSFFGSMRTPTHVIQRPSAVHAPQFTLVASVRDLGMFWLRRSTGLRSVPGGLLRSVFVVDRVVSVSVSQLGLRCAVPQVV